MNCLSKLNILQGLMLHFVFMSALFFSGAVDARPKVGLVLGGGGAKGAAHVGVLEVLEQHRIPIDYIAGTSMGSVVAGMYATGLTIDEIKKVMLEADWDRGYSDRIPRESLPWRVKRQYDQFNIPLEIGLENGQLKMPSGILYGHEVTKLLRAAIGELPNFKSFDDLAVPYRAIATNLASHEAVIIDRGSLVTAMRASSSVPGMLAPEYIDGLLLVDGGITKNLPVDVAITMGADIIIAVDIGSGLKIQEELKSTLDVMSQLSDFLTNSNVIAQKKLLSAKDFLIEPNIEGLSTTDWSFAHEAYLRGKMAANEQVIGLSALSLDEVSYQEYRLSILNSRNQLIESAKESITAIQLMKNSSVSDELILDRLGVELGNVMNALDINDAADRLFSIDEFQRIDIFTSQSENGKNLHVIAEDKSWGPNFLQFGIGWEDDLDNNSDLSFDIAYTLTDVTHNGGEWRSELEIGTRRSFGTELYVPLDGKRNFYSSSRYGFDAFEWDVFVEEMTPMPIDQQFHSLSQGIGYNFSQPGFVETGFSVDIGEFSDPVLLKGTIDYFTYGSYLKLGFDTLDSINFPTEGFYINASSFLRHENVDDHPIVSRADNEDLIASLIVDVNLKGAIKFGNHAVVAKAAYSEAFTENNNESIYISYLGGFLNLSGYQKNALAGSKKVFSAGVYQFDLGRSFFNLAQFPLYLGLSFEAGNVWQQGQEVNHQDLILSSSTYIGTDTSLGPVALGYGRTDTDVQTFYFYLGKNF